MTAVADAIGEGRIGGRLWLYANYHCNLRCTYCLTESAPGVERRLLAPEAMVERAHEARELGFTAYDPDERDRLCALHRSLGVGDEDHVVRPIVRRGRPRGRHGFTARNPLSMNLRRPVGRRTMTRGMVSP